MIKKMYHKIITFYDRYLLGLLRKLFPAKTNSDKLLYKQARINQKNQLRVLEKLRVAVKHRKLKVGFLLIDNQKWNADSLYSIFKKSEYFDPCVVVTLLAKIHTGEERYRQGLQENVAFLKKLNLDIIKGYNEKTKEYVNLKDLGLDIIFYSSPARIEFSETQYVSNTSKHALLCYIPYAVAEAPCSMKCNKLFFESIFKNYIISQKIAPKITETVVKKNRKSLVVTGHPKLDEYLKPKNVVKDAKLTIIYAPHFTMGKRFFSTGTFDWSGMFILEYAKQHPEYNWIFKPHPLFKTGLISRIPYMTEAEMDNYFDEWRKIGTVYEYGHYFNLFKKSDLMITDSASFLLEYYPTQNPVIRLMSKNYTWNNALTEMVAGTYYLVHNIDELKDALKTVAEERQDPLKEHRLKYLNLFQPHIGLAAEKIYQDLIGELKVEQEVAK